VRTRPSGNRRKVYRLALYGVRASGKTCILSALSMPRATNPGRYTCSWIEEEASNPLPQGDPSEWVTSDPFHLGWRWLAEQRDRLKRGEVPQANAIRDEPTRYRFDFTAPERGAFRAELIDYSGELITATSSELAARLREHMQNCDGLLLLAEAPHPGRDLAPLTDDFEKLKAAFNVLLGERDPSSRQDWPVAILLNKWDRRGPITFDDPDAERRRLEDFLDGRSTLPHRGLVHLVENVVSGKNVLVYPVSAFGAHEIDEDGAERPRLDEGQLGSFGLEDPFVWLAVRRDELDLQRFEATVSSCSRWQFWHQFYGRRSMGGGGAANTVAGQLRGYSPWHCLATGLRLRERFTEGCPSEGRLSALLSVVWLRLGTQIVVGLAVLIASLLGGEAILDGVAHRRILADERNPALSDASFQADEAWLEGYFASPTYRHMIAKQAFLDPTRSHEALDRVRAARQEAAWEPVRNAKDPGIKAVKAGDYLRGYPKGPHSPEATLLVIAGKERENLDHLQKIRGELETLPGSDALAEKTVQSIMSRLDAIPHPSVVTDAIYKEKASLRDRLFHRLKEAKTAAAGERWRTFRAEVLDLLRQKKVGPAAGRLAWWDPGDSHMKELVDIFAEQCVSIVRDQVEQDLKSRTWSAARNKLKSARDDMSVTKLLGLAQIQALESLGHKIDETQDRDMYDQIKKNRGNPGSYVDQYLKSAPLGRMHGAILAYKGYLDRMNGPLDLKLVLQQIDWGDARHNETHEVRVTVDGKPLIEASLTAFRHTRTGQVGAAADIHKAPSDEIRVQVKVTQKAWIVGKDHDAGTGEYTGTVSGLNGSTLDLAAPDHTNKATFIVTGFPEKPHLPAWNEN